MSALTETLAAIRDALAGRTRTTHPLTCNYLLCEQTVAHLNRYQMSHLRRGWPIPCSCGDGHLTSEAGLPALLTKDETFAAVNDTVDPYHLTDDDARLVLNHLMVTALPEVAAAICEIKEPQA